MFIFPIEDSVHLHSLLWRPCVSLYLLCSQTRTLYIQSLSPRTSLWKSIFVLRNQVQTDLLSANKARLCSLSQHDLLQVYGLSFDSFIIPVKDRLYPFTGSPCVSMYLLFSQIKDRLYRVPYIYRCPRSIFCKSVSSIFSMKYGVSPLSQVDLL